MAYPACPAQFKSPMKKRLPAAAPTVFGLLGASLLITSYAMKPGRAQSQQGISSPTPGVICDQMGPICYDRQGASVRLTQTYFGSNAANRLNNQLRTRPATNDVLLSNGALCDLRAVTCWSDGWRKSQVSTQLSQELFGLDSSTNAGYGSGLQGLQTPGAGVACDPSTKTCYDQRGLSLRWVPFIGQSWPLTSLTQGGRNGFLYTCRPHGEFCPPGNCGVLHGHTSIGIEPG